MSELLPVENHRDLVRDPTSQAILTTSNKEILEYKERKRIAQAKTDRINRLEDNVAKILEELSKISERLSLLEADT